MERNTFITRKPLTGLLCTLLLVASCVSTTEAERDPAREYGPDAKNALDVTSTTPEEHEQWNANTAAWVDYVCSLKPEERQAELARAQREGLTFAVGCGDGQPLNRGK